MAAGLLASLLEGIRCSQPLTVWRRRGREFRLKNTWWKSPLVTNRIRTAGRKTWRKVISVCSKSGNRERRHAVLIPWVTVEAFIVLNLGFFCFHFRYRHLGRVILIGQHSVILIPIAITLQREPKFYGFHMPCKALYDVGLYDLTSQFPSTRLIHASHVIRVFRAAHESRIRHPIICASEEWGSEDEWRRNWRESGLHTVQCIPNDLLVVADALYPTQRPFIRSPFPSPRNRQLIWFHVFGV